MAQVAAFVTREAITINLVFFVVEKNCSLVKISQKRIFVLNIFYAFSITTIRQILHLESKTKKEAIFFFSFFVQTT